MRTQADDLAAGKHVQSTDDLDAVEAELESVPAEEKMCIRDRAVDSRCPEQAARRPSCQTPGKERTFS